MHHGGHMGHGGASGMVGGGVEVLLGLVPWLLLGAILLIGVAVLAWWLYKRNSVLADSAAGDQQSIRENIDGQIQSMLTQAGGAMDQTQIRANLGLPVEEVAAALGRLEKEGRITRVWQPAGDTYLVESRSHAGSQGAA